MRKFIFLVIISSVISSNLFSQKNQVWMVGPMLHFNFGNKEMRTSFGLEVAYWNYDGFPYSVDCGIEFEKRKIRLYTEGQTGIALAGVSLGPVLEFRKDDTSKLGVQGSLWANYFGGIDFRYRAIAGDSYLSPGAYFKIPLGTGDDVDGDDDDWDWDD